jgi:elongator complex protein 6
VLVSWMREYEFWRQEARKGGGLDLERLRREGRFALVDGLGGLFLEGDTMKEEETKKIPVARGQQQVFPVRGAPGAPLGRMSAVPARDPPAPASTATTAPAPTPTLGLFTLRSSSLAHLESTIHSAIAHLASSPKTPRKTLLILDNPDILLATSPSLSPSSLTSLILNLHTQPNVSHVLVHLQADTPLLGLSTPPQPLEVAQRNMVVKTAHMSRRVLGVRVLDTGVARDVSGVLRVTGNNGGWADLQVRGDDEEEADGREMLYKVNGDGSVKVFERGAGGDG